MYFGDDNKLLESASQTVEEVVAALPKAEQSEYQKRVRTYQNSVVQQHKLIKDKNLLNENYQAKVKENERLKIVGILVFFAYLVADWLFNFLGGEKTSMLVLFSSAYLAYLLLTEKIYASEYVLKMKLYELEIERSDFEISKIGVFSSIYKYNSMENYGALSEEMQSKIRFENECYQTNYRIEILKGMCVVEDIAEAARLRIAR